jgi:hypothetical protein
LNNRHSVWGVSQISDGPAERFAHAAVAAPAIDQNGAMNKKKGGLAAALSAKKNFVSCLRTSS